MQGSCVPDFPHQALASKDGQSMASQDEAFTQTTLAYRKKKLQEKYYEKILTGFMRCFLPFPAPVQGKDFVCMNTYFHTILYVPVFCQ